LFKDIIVWHDLPQLEKSLDCEDCFQQKLINWNFLPRTLTIFTVNFFFFYSSFLILVIRASPADPSYHFIPPIDASKEKFTVASSDLDILTMKPPSGADKTD
jgi:hypothetical protein